MLDSLEGKRGEVRAKPPIPAITGLFGRPTAVNNVLTLCAVPMILADGARRTPSSAPAARAAPRSSSSPATSSRAASSSCRSGSRLRELVEDYGGGTPVRPSGARRPGRRPARRLRAAGRLRPADGLRGVRRAAGAMLGHGGIVVFDETVDMARMARFAMEFCSIESCGKCTPCRVGSTRGVETIDRIIAGSDVAANLVLLDDLCETMTKGSLCAMGGLTPMPGAERDQALPRGLRAADARRAPA